MEGIGGYHDSSMLIKLPYETYTSANISSLHAVTATIQEGVGSKSSLHI
jgi:hypothetical protein